MWPQVVRGGVYSVKWPWMPSLDIVLHFRLDGLSLLFGLIITGIGFLVTLFAASYMADETELVGKLVEQARLDGRKRKRVGEIAREPVLHGVFEELTDEITLPQWKLV